MTGLRQDTRDAQQTVVSRRDFMVGAAGLTFGVSLGLFDGGREIGATAQAATGNGLALSPWVTIAGDGTIAIMSPATEMGQGSTTSLPLILAEELRRDRGWCAAVARCHETRHAMGRRCSGSRAR